MSLGCPVIRVVIIFIIEKLGIRSKKWFIFARLIPCVVRILHAEGIFFGALKCFELVVTNSRFESSAKKYPCIGY